MNEQTTTPIGAPPPPPRPWRLVRGRHDKLAGVCAGLAAAAGLDVTLVRLAFVLAGLGGFGVVAYLVLMFVVPKEDPAQGDYLLPAPPNVAQWIRIALGLGAVIGLISVFDSGPRFFDAGDGFGFGLGLVFLIVGAVILWQRRGRSPVGSVPTPPLPGAPTGSQPGAPGTPSESATPGWPRPDAAMTSTPTAPISGAIVGGAGPVPGSTPDAAIPTMTGAMPTGEVPTQVLPPVPVSAPPMPAGERTAKVPGGAIVARVFGWLAVLGTVPLAIAVGAMVRVRALSLPVPYLFLVLAVAVIVNLMVWSSVARRVTFVAIAVALIAALGGVVALASHWNGDIGERFERPLTRTDLPATYRMAMGHEVVDLSQLRVTGDPVSLAIDHRIGLLEVVVPDAATVDIHSDVTAGALEVFGTHRDGMTLSYDATDGTSEQSRYELDISVGYGRLEVCRASDAHLVGGTLRCVGDGR